MMTSLSSRSLLYAFVFSAILCGATACGGKGSSESPLAPSAAATPVPPASPALAGATIDGKMLVPGTSTSSFRVLGTPAATVTVVGTSLSATVGGDGSFSISGLPLGDVILQFTVSGTSARVTVSSVVENEHIQLTVSVSGPTATVVTIQRVTSDNRTELEGAVTALAGVCPAVTFTVNGTSVLTNASTQFDGTGCSTIRAGAKVEVKGTRQANGSVLALKVNVEVETIEIEGTVSAATGTCPVLSFTANGTTILTTASTQFNGAGCLAVRTGAKVEVKGTRQANGSVLALKVNVEVETIEVEGTVSAATGTCPVLSFTANGTTILTTASTQFNGAGCPAVQTGAKVEVKGTRQANGSVLALKVNVEVAEIEIEGKVGSIAGICPGLTFSLNGTSITASAATQYKGGSCSSIKIGTKVGVKGTRQANGSVLASRVEIGD